MPSVLWCQDSDVYDVVLTTRELKPENAKLLTDMGYEPLFGTDPAGNANSIPATLRGELNGKLSSSDTEPLSAGKDANSRTLYLLRCKAVKAGLRSANTVVRDAMTRFLTPISDITLVAVPHAGIPEAEKEALVMRMRERQYELLEPWYPELLTASTMVGVSEWYHPQGLQKAVLNVKGLFKAQHTNSADLNVNRDTKKPMVFVFLQRGGAR
jgi:hypothetical protein